MEFEYLLNIPLSSLTTDRIEDPTRLTRRSSDLVSSRDGYPGVLQPPGGDTQMITPESVRNIPKQWI